MNKQETITAIEALPRYRGDNVTNGPAEWSAAFCRKMDARHELSAAVADAAVEHDLVETVPTGSLKRGDLVMWKWAGGGRSFDCVVEVRVAHDGNGWEILTTATGGLFRVQSRMWTTSTTVRAVRQAHALDSVEQLEESLEFARGNLSAREQQRIERALDNARLARGIARCTGSTSCNVTTEHVPLRHASHVAWLQHQYALTAAEAEAEAQRRYNAYPDEVARWNEVAR